MKYKLIIIPCLLVFIILILLPPIIHGYIYPTAGDDTASHLIYFKNIDTQKPLYYGQYVVGKLINLLPFNPTITFLWFNFAILILIILTIGLVVGYCVNYLAGLLAVILVFGASQLLNLFYYGTIFDLMGIGIILPIALLCLYKRKENIGWMIGAIISLIAFAFFHKNGLYILAFIPIIMWYEIMRRIISQRLAGIYRRIWNNRLIMYIGLMVVALVILYGLSLIILPIRNAMTDPMRIMRDASILFIIVVSGILGYWFLRKAKLLKYGIVALAIIISIPSCIEWMQNNSAIKDVDKEAIAYLNGLNGQIYTTSAQVAQDIYGLYVNKKIGDTAEANYAVIRTTPMTLKSDPTSDGFENQDRLVIQYELNAYGYKLINKMDCGEKDRITGNPIIISVYAR